MHFATMALTLLGTTAAVVDTTSVERVARLKVFFGHQSVGDNLLTGVRSVAPALRIVRGEAAPEAPALVETLIGRNQDPESKLVHFARAMETLGDHVDIAMMKLCYIDFSAGIDVESLKRTYSGTMAELQRRYTSTRFVHVTVPLTTVQGGIKASIGRLLGRVPWGEQENVARGRFNAWLRATYGAESVFDLANLESQAADGKAAWFERDGERFPMLAPTNTTDGGHLTLEASQRIAVAFVEFLARLASTNSGTRP